MKRWRMIVSVAMLLALGALATVGATAQPEPTDHSNLGMERDRARLFLQRRIEALEREQADLRSAIESIDAGAPLEDIRERMAEAERRGRDIELTPELRERALRVFEATSPELFRRWRELNERDPERAAQMRERIVHRIQDEGPLREMLSLLDRDPELFQLRARQFGLERRAYFTARRFVEATARGDDAEAAAAREEIRVLLNEQLDHRFAEQRKAMREAESRLQDMRKRLEEQSHRRDELIERRVEEIIRRVMRRSGEGDGTRRHGHERAPDAAR